MMNTSDRNIIRWGIVGLGRFGAIHAETIQSLPGSQLVAVCNRHQDQLDRFTARDEVDLVTTDWRYVVHAPGVDVISITTHWKQHFEIARSALQAGKHVFLEKPMASTSDECRQLLALAASADGEFMVGHVCRFDPRISLAKEAIDEGRIGDILSMHARRNLPRAPGNIRFDKISPLMGDGIHDADLMLWFTGKLPSRVYARNISSGEFQYPEIGWAMLEFDTATGVIETNWCLPESTPTVIDARIDIVGTRGRITVDCSDTGLTVTDAHGPKMKDTAYWPVQHGKRTGALASELGYFAECLRSGTSPTVITPREAARAVVVMEAAELSAQRGQPCEFSPGDFP